MVQNKKSLIGRRVEFLEEVLVERGDAFLGVEIYTGSEGKFFGRGHLLEVVRDSDSGPAVLLVDVRKTLRSQLKEAGITIPGILMLDTAKFSEEEGFPVGRLAHAFLTD